MSTWRYRVIRHTSPPGSVTQYDYVAIHEHYTFEDGTESWSATPDRVTADNPTELRWMLEQMLAALDEPTLELPELTARIPNSRRDIAREINHMTTTQVDEALRTALIEEEGDADA